MADMRIQLKRILSNNLYMNLATSSSNGQPWSTPVFYAFDGSNTFYWYSRKDTRHSLLINKNQKVAASIFGTSQLDEGIGVYLEGVAGEVEEDELSSALEIYAKKGAANEEERKQLTAKEDFLNDSPIRMYKLVTNKIYISNEAKKWKGKWLDTRSEIKY